ncbi:hypothetical protein B0H10DRAFT_1940517 [Mycena sp. CBHHK59/15]|nr:hypothetical protein B0H10DRAFT_1940517 [Mycena sp. CBHHK59/15]
MCTVGVRKKQACYYKLLQTLPAKSGFADDGRETQRWSAPLFLTSAISTSGRPPPPVSSAPVAGGLPSFTFPANYGYSSPSSMDPTGFFAHPAPPLPSLPSDLFPFHPELAAPGSWDAGSSSSWSPASIQEPSRPGTPQWDDRSIQPDWDDLVSSFQPAAARTPSTGSSAGNFPNDSYGIDLLMANISSVFSSAPPSSIPEDDDWSSRGWSSSGSCPVSAAPSSAYSNWDGTNWATADLPCIEADVPPADEAPDMDARLGWDFKPSNVKWLDPDVSSEVAEFPQGIRLTEKNKIYAFHRVTGCPSQFPFFRNAPASSSISLTTLTPGGGAPGLETNPMSCRRAAPECGGVTACESLDPAFLKGERRELDPEDIRSLAAATLRTHEMQDDTEVGRTLAFHNSLQRWRCRGIRTDGSQCDGSICLRKLNTPFHNKSHILLCSKRGEALTFGALHSQVHILDHVSEELFVKVMNGERIIDEDDTEGTCSRVVSGRTGSKGKGICPFNHHKNGLPYVAKVEPVTCAAKMHIYCPWETLHPELAWMAIVVPLPESGHSHPPPPKNKCSHAIAGIGSVFASLVLGQLSTRLRMPGLISRDTKTRIIQELKAEWNKLSSTATNTRQQVVTYLADQESLTDEKRYLQSSLSREGKRIIFGAHPKLLHSIHDLRTLDCDTTFKPVAGDMQIFEINGWLVVINEGTSMFFGFFINPNRDPIAVVTVMCVWMEVHDRAAYKTVWEEIQRLVLKLTKKQLKFKGLHKGGKILGLNSDMEAAPLLGFGDAFVATVDIEDVRSAVAVTRRSCFRSSCESGIPKLLNHSRETRQRIFDLKYLKTREEVEAFKAWIVTLADPQGVLKRWWEHKLMHRWLLRDIIQCLSNIPLEQWNTMEATTNLGEAQHAWNNAQTGISMGVIESFKNTESKRDTKNSTSDEPRRSSQTTRQTRMSEKARRAHAVDSTVAGLHTELADMRRDLAIAHNDAKTEPSTETAQHERELEDTLADLEGKLKLAKAEVKASSSSGRVRAPKAGARATTSNVPAQPADSPGPALSITVVATSASSELSLATPVSVADGTSDLAGTRCASTRKHVQAESSAATSIPSRKRQKKLEDPLAGSMVVDPDTCEELTGHQWVERYPEEFEKRYKKDHQHYIDYLAQLG